MRSRKTTLRSSKSKKKRRNSCASKSKKSEKGKRLLRLNAGPNLQKPNVAA